MALGKRLINTGGVAACTADSTDPFGDSSGLALYNLDYDASDASGNYDGTPTNVDFGVGGQINWGARFNGSSSYIDTPITPSLLGELFSVSIWFKTSTTSTYQTLVDNGGNTSGSSGFAIFINTDNTLRASFTNGGGGGASDVFTLNTNTTVTDGDWHNCILTYNNESAKLYLDNGTPFSGTNTEPFTQAANNIRLGAYVLDNTILEFNGDIDQVRIFSKELNSTEVGTLYAETACVYTATTTDNNYPVANTMYHKLDNSADDEIGTATSTEQEMQYRFGKYGQAGLFDGLSNGSEINTNYTVADTALTHSIWINQSGIGHDGFNVVLGRYWDGTTPLHLGYYIWTNTTTINWRVFYGGDGGSTSQNVQASGTISQNQWHHIVATWTDGTGAKLYIDGSLAQAVSSSQTRNKNGINLALGGFGHNISGQANFKGLLDTHRYFNSELSASQVTELYNEKPEVDTSNFKTVLYEGNSGHNYISNVGMDLETSGGLVWIKSRTSNAYPNNVLQDSVRGANQYLISDSAGQQYTNATFGSFDANGFTLTTSNVTWNGSGSDYVAWNWKGGGEAVNIGVNSITGSTPSRASSVSANTAAGFSIVSLDKPNTNTDTYGHGLSSIVEMIILKRTASPDDDWYVYHKDLGNSVRISLNSDAAKVTGTGVWASTTPTASLFTLQNQTGGAHIAYCFHSVAGYSKIGSYSGGSSGSSNVIVTGFKPSFLMVKRTDQAGDAWQLFDIVRGGSDTFDNYLQANNSNIEASYSAREVNFTTNGFYWTNAESGTNISGGTYIYMAFK